MKKMKRYAGALVLVGVVGACAAPDPFAIQTVPKGEQIGVRALVANNPGARGCVDYDAASNSCAALTRTRISGNTLIGQEITAVLDPDTGQAARIEIATRGRIVGKDACVNAEGVRVGKGSGAREIAEFIVGFAREAIAARGEVCSSYFKAGDGYVLSSRGADGQPFPPGDTSFRILNGPVSLRLQDGL